MFPCVARDANKVFLSFIGTARHGTGPLTHFLYRTSGPDLEHLKPPQRVGDSPCYAGFSRPDLTVTATGDDGHIRLDGKMRASVDTDFDTISRISFCFDHPSRLLITGVSKSDRARSGSAALHRTIVYDVDQRQVIGQLQVDGQPLYKPTICEGLIAYSGEQQHVREGWKLRAADRFDMQPTDVQARLETRKK